MNETVLDPFQIKAERRAQHIAKLQRIVAEKNETIAGQRRAIDQLRREVIALRRAVEAADGGRADDPPPQDVAHHPAPSRGGDSVNARRLTVSTGAHDAYGGPRRYFRLAVHDSRDEMRHAAKRYDGTDLDPEALACCQPAPVKPDGTGPAHFGGVVRFNRDDLTPEVVIHEMTHAAAVVYRMDVDPRVDLGNGCRAEEEWLAHLVGDLADAALTALIEAEEWPA